MSQLSLLLIALFLPLFPMSMVFNLLVSKLTHPVLRIILFLGWPLIGLLLIKILAISLPDWLVPWALLTSALYALRLLSLRELNHWLGFLATSLWALLWIPLHEGYQPGSLWLDAMGFSAPLVLLVIVAELLRRRFGAAYTQLYGGLAHQLPRLSMVLVLAVLAAIGTPVFPTFFSLLSILMIASPATILSLLAIWLLWSWAGARLLQGFIVGTTVYDQSIRDIAWPWAWALYIVLVALIFTGITLTGVLL